MRKSSVETYRGQRNKEKRDLFGRFRVRAIEDLYKSKFFALFEHRCFKCGKNEKPFPEVGKPPVLCIDHHIPMALGGHLIPGNLVSLCRDCNGAKLDSPPEAFYSPDELKRLEPILNRQEEIFSFVFDFDAWKSDRKEYLLKVGVPAAIVHNILFNPDHPEFIGIGDESSHNVTIEVDVDIDFDELLREVL